MIATFKVYDKGKIIEEYYMEYNSHKELHNLFHEARKVWAEYHVVAETSEYNMTYSHTYKEQYGFK